MHPSIRGSCLGGSSKQYREHTAEGLQRIQDSIERGGNVGMIPNDFLANKVQCLQKTKDF